MREINTNRQRATALLAVAVLVILLVVGGIWAWRAGRSTASAARQTTSGPVAKMTAWVEPPPQVLSGHKTAVLWVAFSPDGKRLAIANSGNTAKLWDATSGKEIQTLRAGELKTITWKDGHRVITAGDTGGSRP